MPVPRTIPEIMEISRRNRKEITEQIDREITHYALLREGQVKLSQDDRSKLNFLSFAIVGSILSFKPESLESLLVVVGLFILLANSLLFGFVADDFQRRNNIQNAEDAISESKRGAMPFFDAYDDMGRYLDAVPLDPTVFQQKYSKMEDEYLKYLEWHKEKTREPRLAKRTKLAIGYKYYAIFALGLLLAGIGLVNLQRKPQIATTEIHGTAIYNLR